MTQHEGCASKANQPKGVDYHDVGNRRVHLRIPDGSVTNRQPDQAKDACYGTEGFSYEEPSVFFFCLS